MIQWLATAALAGSAVGAPVNYAALLHPAVYYWFEELQVWHGDGDVCDFENMTSTACCGKFDPNQAQWFTL